MLLKSKTLDAGAVRHIVESVSAMPYRCNLTCNTDDRGKKRNGEHHTRFTLAVADSWGPGARTSASGRHMPKASWEAHRDVMERLFAVDPGAVLVTALATYRGQADFESSFEATGAKNVGSQMQPVTMRETTV